jgi:putative radical SAM enzyme (TIGR03279 family)
MGSTIKTIEQESPLLGKVHPGEKLLSINGNPIVDVLDYKYYAYDRKLELELETPAGQHRRVQVKKAEGADLGLEFDTYLMDRARSCANRCVFCFVDQLPKGLRPTLYFKDDDARLSFLTGNYITLTNLSQREIQRICDLKISPINISVHATNPELRAKLLGNRRGAEGMEIIRRFAEAGIVMECQIVCCPGLNDGAELQRSMEDLAVLYPQVGSVSIVPVGLTKHREGLFAMTPFDREKAAVTIDQVERFASRCLETRGSRIFFCADELYLKAGRDLPPDEAYEEYPQLENGVGLLRLQETEFLAALCLTEPDEGVKDPFSIATGVAAAPFLQKLLLTAQKKCDKIYGTIYPVINDFFGHTIDVAGLVTGGDLIAQLRGRELGNRLLIPQSMLRHGEGVFLDDVTLTDVERELGVPIQIIPQDGGALLDAMLSISF